jgi:hypothetical protein
MPADPTERPEAPGSRRARLREAVDDYAYACMRLGALPNSVPLTDDANLKRAALDTLHDDLARDAERLVLAETVLGNFRGAHCLRALLGEDSDECECMGCASRAYFAARSAPLVPEDGDA